MDRVLVGLGVLLGAAVTAGCGDDGVACTGEALAVAPEKRLVDLDGGERNAVCDWGACQFGGYGAQPLCPDGVSLRLAANRRQCLDSTSSNPACLATVADWNRCMAAVRIKPCAETLFLGDECAALTTQECVVIRPSASSDPATSPPAGDVLRDRGGTFVHVQ